MLDTVFPKIHKEGHKFIVIFGLATVILYLINGLLGLIFQVFEETKLPIWICGGDAPIILNELKNTNIDITHCPNLVLEGMIDIDQKINSI